MKTSMPTRFTSIELLENRDVPTAGLVGGLLGTLGAVGAAASLTANTDAQIGLSVAGVTAGIGTKVGTGVNATVANGAVGVTANAKVGASVNACLPTTNALFGTATGLVDIVLADVNSLLPGVSI